MLYDLLYKDTVFHDLYFRLDGSLYPIPVLIANIKRGGVSVNEASDQRNWILTRRFFVVDNVSGKNKLGDSPLLIQYANKLDICFRLRSSGKIYPPLLKITYNVVDMSHSSGRDEFAVSFKISYVMNTDNIKRNVSIAAIMLSILAVFYSLFNYLRYKKRNGIVVTTCSHLFIIFVYLCSALGLSLFLLTACLSVHWFLLYKLQTTVIRVLPTQIVIEPILITAFCMQTINIAYKLYSQIHVDIFFIDWERPRPGKNEMNKKDKEEVSIIRTLFVANEWRELQTARKLSPVVLFFILMICIKVIGFENWTTNEPELRVDVDQTLTNSSQVDLTMRIAVICLLYLVITFVLWMLFYLLYMRFVGDQVDNFVDFCSLSNVSVLILSDLQFGYYIHGASVHGFAHVDLLQLYQQFQREENNLCSTRGLEPNSSIQTFEIALTMKFRAEFDRILQLMLNPKDTTTLTKQHTIHLREALSGKLENSVIAYNIMNKYLSSFLDHSFSDNDYVVKDKVLSERLLRNEVFSPSSHCIFYRDSANYFTNVLLCGMEWELLVYYLLLLIVVDWWSNYNFVLAIVVVYFCDLLVVKIRDHFGTQNLSTKAMVHRRFLM